MLNTTLEPLKAINVGINNDEGSVDRLMSVDELARVGCVDLNMHNYANFGGAVYELTIGRPPTSQHNSTFGSKRTNNGEAISLMDNRWKKTVIRSTRFSPVLMDMIKTECKCRRIDFSNYIRLAATACMKHSKKTGTAEAAKTSTP